MFGAVYADAYLFHRRDIIPTDSGVTNVLLAGFGTDRLRCELTS